MLHLAMMLATQAAAASLQPAGPWAIGTEKSDCILSRDYSVPDGSVTLGLRRWPLSRYAQLLIALPRDGRGSPAHVSLDLGAGSAVDLPVMGAGRAADKVVLLADLPPALAISLPDASQVRLVVNARTMLVPLTSMAAAKTAMSRCQAALLRDWRIDPAEQADYERASPPAGKGFTSPAAYPPEAIVRHETGTAVLVLGIGMDGRVAVCNVVESTGFDDLDKASCAMVQGQVKFAPATNAAGAVVASHQLMRMSWRLPGG